uniref:CSON005397 protein n=1 Tax=Culicoides sonorensis TaxID=179676 RepID=A0A336MQD8_CULSO
MFSIMDLLNPHLSKSKSFSKFDALQKSASKTNVNGKTGSISDEKFVQSEKNKSFDVHNLD